MIKIIVGNTHCSIDGELDAKIISQIDEELSFFVEGYQFSKAYRDGFWDNRIKKFKRWDGKKHLLTKDLRFLTGFLKRVQRLLKSNDVLFEVVDSRQTTPVFDKIETKNIECREYQDRIHSACLANDMGVIRACTGSGKSICMARLIADTNLKTNLFVVGVDLLYQMKSTLERTLKTKIGIIGDSKCEIHRINVISVWTACSALGEKYTPHDDECKKESVKDRDKARIIKAINNAEMVLLDECHTVAMNSTQVINNACKSAKRKYGFSGTPYRTDGSDLLIEGICGPIIVEVTASELIAKGFLVEPRIYFVNVPKLETDGENYQTIYKKYIIENDTRNDKIVKIAEELIEKGRNVLILVKHIKHGDILLERLIKNNVVYFVRGDVDSDERKRIKEEFESGRLKMLIATNIYDVGVDIPILNSLILAGASKSSIRALQRIGRVIRGFPGKKEAIVIDFMDQCKYLSKHAEERIKVYKTEPGFKLKLPEIKNQPVKNKVKKKIFKKEDTW